MSKESVHNFMKTEMFREHTAIHHVVDIMTSEMSKRKDGVNAMIHNVNGFSEVTAI